MSWSVNPYIEYGKIEGKAEGMTEGRILGRTEGNAEGEAKALTIVLQKRFGEISAAIREQILAADIQSLEAWLARAAQAADLESIFGTH